MRPLSISSGISAVSCRQWVWGSPISAPVAVRRAGLPAGLRAAEKTALVSGCRGNRLTGGHLLLPVANAPVTGYWLLLHRRLHLLPRHIGLLRRLHGHLLLLLHLVLLLQDLLLLLLPEGLLLLPCQLLLFHAFPLQLLLLSAGAGLARKEIPDPGRSQVHRQQDAEHGQHKDNHRAQHRSQIIPQRPGQDGSHGAAAVRVHHFGAF